MFADIIRGLLGIAVLLAICFALSANRRAINWRLVGGGIGLQILLAISFFLVPGFSHLITWISKAFVTLLGFTNEGTAFLFGNLADPNTPLGPDGDTVAGERSPLQLGTVFAFHILPTILFFSALASLLYYFGILQRIVYGLAWVMSRLMKLSSAETLAAAANVFVGQTEAPLVVKPYIQKMTRSELMALMTGGMATIAGGVLAAYVGMLGGDSAESQQVFAKALLCASFMNAPAALLVAKMLLPETGEVNRDLFIPRERAGTNAFDAIAQGTTDGLRLAMNVGAMLIVFVALIAAVNFVFTGWIGSLPVGGGDTLNDLVSRLSGGVFDGLSLESICGVVFAPIAWIIGVEGPDVLQAGELIGIKLIATEFIAYQNLGELKAAGALSPRTIFLATFALCGFANFTSIGIQLGGIGALAPERRADLASLGFKAMIGGAIASLLSASVAGMFYSVAD